MKQLRPAGGSNQAPALQDVVDGIVSLRSGKSAILVGPAFEQHGRFFRVVAFPGRSASVSTLAIDLGPTAPSVAAAAELTGLLRQKFWSVRLFVNAIEWSRAAQKMWPSDRADKLVAIALTGPGGLVDLT